MDLSVFLRILEYYNGVLFLTTNRVGKLDPAITSRVHLNLHYRRLQATEFRNVFNLNIEKLEEIEEQRRALFNEPKLYILKDEILQFASEHYHSTGSGRESWNGRQIRNAFLIAASLARYEAEQQDENFQPQLRASHFREVESVTREFDQFRKHLKGGDDAEVARRREERDDTWEEAEETMMQGQPPPPPRVQHTMKTYHSPRSAASSVPAGYPPRNLSPQSTPSRSYGQGQAYSTPAPAHLSPEYSHASHSTPPRVRSQEQLPRQYNVQPPAAQPGPSGQQQHAGPPFFGGALGHQQPPLAGSAGAVGPEERNVYEYPANYPEGEGRA